MRIAKRSVLATFAVLALAAAPCAAGADAPSGSAQPKLGRVMFWYDTEDYISEKAPDAALFHAKLLTEFGYRGNFAIVGFYAQRLQERGRTDVIEALKRHCIGSQTLYHSRHPTICEYTDVADWNAAYRRCLAEEADCIGRLKGVFGRDEISFFVPPGTSVTPVPMYVYSDLGIKLYGAGIDIFGNAGFDRLAWYANMLQAPYVCGVGAMAAAPTNTDYYASRRLTIIYTHPCQVVAKNFWDAVNYNGTNTCAWRQWKSPETYSPEEIASHQRAWRALLARIKGDRRLTVIDAEDLIRSIKPRVAIARADVPLLLAAMEKGLEPIEKPASWSVSDVFQAAVAFLRGEESFVPAKAWGFLEKPVGVTSSVTLRKDDLVAAAKALDANNFLPPQIAVGRAMIGPADFLIAALKVLATGADEVTVGPRDQVGPIAKHLPRLASQKLSRKGWCIYSDDFKDDYVSDRLRWQFWTLRYEE